MKTPNLMLACSLALAPSLTLALSIVAPTDRSLPPLPMKSQIIDVRIDGPVARTHLTQVFHNPHPRVLEGHFLMTLPRGAQVTDFIMEINGEWRDKEETKGIEDNNSGGNLVFLSPGLRLRATDAVSIAVSLGLPVVQDTNGVQDEPDYRVISNVSFRF